MERRKRRSFTEEFKAVGVEEIVAQLEERLGVFVLRNYVDRGDSYRVCIDKLRERLGPKLPDFGPDYYRGVIQRYLEAAQPEH